MLARARKHQTSNIELLKMDAEELLFHNERFDYVVLSHVIAVVDNPENVLKEVFRILKPGGKVFILNHFTPDNWLRHVDRLMAGVSRLFCFKSLFYVTSLKNAGQLNLLESVNTGPFSYFKILIYEKSI
jgi:phosphatidylethanolamine/phosphatidyl-N-methylethanolamine N-methyltransferase